MHLNGRYCCTIVVLLLLVIYSLVCIYLHTGYLCNFHKKFPVASTHNTNITYQIWKFCRNWFLSYCDNRHTHTGESLKMCFSNSKALKPCKSFKIFISKIWLKNNTFYSIFRYEKVKKAFSELKIFNSFSLKF